MATALLATDGGELEARLFLMSDATVLALPNQVDGPGNGLQGMVEGVVRHGVTIRIRPPVPWHEGRPVCP